MIYTDNIIPDTPSATDVPCGTPVYGMLRVRVSSIVPGGDNPLPSRVYRGIVMPGIHKFFPSDYQGVSWDSYSFVYADSEQEAYEGAYGLAMEELEEYKKALGDMFAEYLPAAGKEG